MKTNDNQYYIYLRATKQRIPCTKEQFDDYYRDINAYRRTQQNHGRCVCPPSKRLSCDMDCFNCPYHTSGDMSSLDRGRVDDEGEEMSWLDHLQEEMPDLQEPSPADYVTDTIYIMVSPLLRLKWTPDIKSDFPSISARSKKRNVQHFMNSSNGFVLRSFFIGEARRQNGSLLYVRLFFY